MGRNRTVSDEKLTDRQLAAIEALCTEPRLGHAAKQAKIARSTLHRWMQDPQFVEGYRAARRGLLDSALIRLEAIAAGAVETLSSVMQDETAHPSARVAAARCSLELLLRLRESIDLESRITALEGRLGSRA